MTKEIQLESISQRITALFGLLFSPRQYDSLERSVINAARELKKSTTIEAINEWISQPDIKEEELKVLANFLTIGETYFFREKIALDLLQNKIIAEILEQRKGLNQHIRIWSAGCSSGEEPYTIAILLKESIPDIQNWNISILATDISSEALKKAKSGTYTAWSFRETSEVIKRKYFTENGRNFTINDEIKKMVHFSQLNLSCDSFPSTMNNTQGIDVIFCRNVLMYFLPESAKQVSKRFHLALNPNGWLITSQVELIDDYFSLFERIMFGQGIFYRKTENADRSSYRSKSLALKQNEVPKSKNSFEINARQVPKDINQAIGKRKIQTNHVASSRPDNAVVLNKSVEGLKLLEESKYSECVDWCLKRLSEKKDDSEIIIILIKANANLGKLDIARDWAEYLMKNAGLDIGIMYIYASILMEQKDWNMAEKILIKILYLKPDHLAAQLYLGNTLKKLGKNQLALKYIQKLIQHLKQLNVDEIVPDFEGMTAGRLLQMTEIYLET